MLTVPMQVVFLYFGDLVHRHQQRQDHAWSITVIDFTVLTVFRYLGACSNGSVRLTCQDGHMDRDGQGLLVPLALKFCAHVNEIRLYWFL